MKKYPRVNQNQKNLSLFWNKYAFQLYEPAESQLPYSVLEKIQMINNTEIMKRVIKEMQHRRDELLKRSRKVFDLIAKLKGKLLVGVGNPSITEVGMTFSRNYGFPLIPGSSLKGCFFAYLLDISYDGEKLKRFFGEDLNEGDNIKGSLIFLDAIPTETIKFSLDLVNNHFVPYYSNPTPPPNDWYNPLPVVYIVVEAGRFRFTVIESQDSEGICEEDKKQLRRYFESVLKDYGVGAKTSYGYGRFEVEGDVKNPADRSSRITGTR